MSHLTPDPPRTHGMRVSPGDQATASSFPGGIRAADRLTDAALFFGHSLLMALPKIIFAIFELPGGVLCLWYEADLQRAAALIRPVEKT